jgi:hypothetical protein
VRTKILHKRILIKFNTGEADWSLSTDSSFC